MVSFIVGVIFFELGHNQQGILNFMTGCTFYWSLHTQLYW